MIQRTIVVALTLFCSSLCTNTLLADSPRVCFGYFLVDRWGQKILTWGPSCTFVSDAVAADLQKYVGKPIEIDASEIYQPVNPSAEMIVKAGTPRVKGSPFMNLEIKIETKNRNTVKGKGLELMISLQNQSHGEVSVWPGALLVVLATNRPFDNRDIGYVSPDGMSYWPHQSDMQDFRTRPIRTLSVACREDKLPWTAKQMVPRGKNLRTQREWDKYGDDVVVFAPGGKFEDHLVVGQQLLTGEYEVFVYLGLGFPCPISNRLPFDVVRKARENVESR